jgi:hypothetical protein
MQDGKEVSEPVGDEQQVRRFLADKRQHLFNVVGGARGPSLAESQHACHSSRNRFILMGNEYHV